MKKNCTSEVIFTDVALTKSFGKVLKNRSGENRSSGNRIMQGPGV